MALSLASLLPNSINGLGSWGAETPSQFTQITNLERQPIVFYIPNSQNPKSPIVVEMRVNPYSIKVVRESLVSSELLREGVVNQFWRPKPDRVDFQGSAGGLKSKDVLNQFQAIVNSINNDSIHSFTNIIQMKYRNRIYEGFIEGPISVSKVATNPRVVEYSFSFIITDGQHFDLSKLSHMESITDIKTLGDINNMLFRSIPALQSIVKGKDLAVSYFDTGKQVLDQVKTFSLTNQVNSAKQEVNMLVNQFTL